MSKLFEICFRLVNIAYANEIADACQAHGIDPQEMVRACATKPYGFMPFAPGLGADGPCIPVNAHYLLVNNDLPLLRSAMYRSAALRNVGCLTTSIQEGALLGVGATWALKVVARVHCNVCRSIYNPTN